VGDDVQIFVDPVEYFFGSSETSARFTAGEEDQTEEDVRARIVAEAEKYGESDVEWEHPEDELDETISNVLEELHAMGLLVLHLLCCTWLMRVWARV